ncbi:MAG: hypothetical protein JNL60_18935 [Bacteroidia bacterium]|nr:hypothetical protein [Bacteroidia bacterium]
MEVNKRRDYYGIKVFKNIASYVQPVIIDIKTGKVTPYLEVVMYRGRYSLNSRNANYSFGGLHEIFESLFRRVKIEQYRFKNILVLGMGAGSVVSILRDDYGIFNPITAVEKDEVVIELAGQYFDIHKNRNLNIVLDDAFHYVANATEKFDLVIVDLFVEGEVPKIFSSVKFLTNLQRIVNSQSCVIYNKMTEDPKHKEELIELSMDFESVFPGSELFTFDVNNSENSILYKNTIPPDKGTKHCK